MTTHARLLTTTALVTSFAALLAVVGCNFTEDLDEVKARAESQRDLSQEASALCLEYCGLASDNCTSEGLFASDNACFMACAGYPTDGIDGDQLGDTVQCRIYHLEAAALDAETHCPHGSPGGGGKCAGKSPCGTYCGFMLERCDEFDFFGDDDEDDIGDIREECVDTCNSYSMLGNDEDETGDSYQCRFRAVIEAGQDATTFCPQAGPDGGGVCTGDIPSGG